MTTVERGPLRAFHGDSAIKAKYLDRVDGHIAAGHLIRGITWTGERGCAVGCTLENDKSALYPVELGIPEWLALIEDALFENMSWDSARSWPRDFLAAIEPGAELERIKGPFLICAIEQARRAIDPVAYEDVASAMDASMALWRWIDAPPEERFKAAARISSFASWAAIGARRAEVALAPGGAQAARAAEAAEYAARAGACPGPWSVTIAARFAANLAAEAAGASAFDHQAQALLELLRGLRPAAAHLSPAGTTADGNQR